MDYFIAELGQSQIIGIPLNMTGEVISIGVAQVCPIPGVKPSLLGAIALRGKLLWLLDLSLLLNFGPTSQNRTNKLTVLVAKYNQKKFGLVVKKLRNIQRGENLKFQLINQSELGENIRYIKGKSDLAEGDDFNLVDLEAIYKYINQ
jgi:twitching motility protein PilI